VWPFNKNQRSAEDMQVNDAWTVAEGNHNGRPMFVRFNSGFRSFRGRSSYPHQVGIAVPLRNPEPSGLPNSTELPELSVIEDEICELLESEKESLFVAIVTTGGMQEYVFYTSSPEQVKLKFDQLRGKITSHKIQLMIQPDKDWRVFDQLTRTK
jgi:hypothetical protein